jgi:hypothetical protein
MWLRVHQSLKVKVTNTVHIKVFLSVLLVNGKIRIRTNTYGLGRPKTYDLDPEHYRDSPLEQAGTTALLDKCKDMVPFPVIWIEISAFHLPASTLFLSF